MTDPTLKLVIAAVFALAIVFSFWSLRRVAAQAQGAEAARVLRLLSFVVPAVQAVLGALVILYLL